jgi:hypothetical protein
MRFLIALLLSGCTFGPYLHWTAPSPTGVRAGRVAVRDVRDVRPRDQGGVDTSRLGTERTLTGDEIAIRPLDHTVPETVARFAGDALAASGFGVTQAGDPHATAHVVAEVRELWCDGYMVYGARVAVDLVVIDPATGAPRARVPLRREEKAGVCMVAFQRAFDGLLGDAVRTLTQPEPRGALLGAAPPN